jgi:hypothetical protein
LSREELDQRAQGRFPLAAPGAPGRTNVPGRGRFAPGDRVRVREDYVPGHVRMPGYIRGKSGVVERVARVPLPGRPCACPRRGGRAHLRRPLPHEDLGRARPTRHWSVPCSRVISSESGSAVSARPRADSPVGGTVSSVFRAPGHRECPRGIGAPSRDAAQARILQFILPATHCVP